MFPTDLQMQIHSLPAEGAVGSADIAVSPVIRVNPISLSYPFPLSLPLSFARSRESKGYPNSGFDRGVGLREVVDTP